MDSNPEKLRITVDFTPGSKWRLADDINLLKSLEKFSEGIINKAAKIQKCMDELDENVISAYLHVKNVSNVFHAVGDTKFVENRTHDEDETQIISDRLKNTEFHVNEDPLANNKKLEESLTNCLRIIEDKFETIQLSESDSDDDGLEHSQVVLKPRKCYVDRPLPHIIGTYEFLNDPTLGLSPFLPEQEDAIETEDEGGTQYLNPSEYPNETQNVEQSSECNSLSGKSLDESISSYEIAVSVDIPEEENKIWRSNISFGPESVVSSDQGIVTIDHEISDSTSKLTSSIISIETDANIKSIKFEETETDQIDNFDKPYSKQLMKSKLEQIYSNPRQDIFSKSKMKIEEEFDEEKMEVDESKSDVSNEPLKSVFIDGLKTDDIKPSIIKDLPKSGSIIKSLNDDVLPDLSIETLHSLSKNRAKIPTKRRLPSRKNRGSGIASGSSSEFLSVSSTVSQHSHSASAFQHSKSVDTLPRESAFNQAISQNINNNLVSPATDEEDLFTVIGNINTSNDTTDRLFQPLKIASTSNNIKKTFAQSDQKKESKTEIEKPKTSIWDPFADDDDDSTLFQSSNTWSAPKFTKRSDKPLGGLVRMPSDDNLFTATKESTSKSLFDDFTSTNDKPIKSIFDNFKTDNKQKTKSLFDDIDDDDDSLFSSNFDIKKNKSDTVPASTTQSTKSKNDFLSDPLAFGNDSETD